MAPGGYRRALPLYGEAECAQLTEACRSLIADSYRRTRRQWRPRPVAAIRGTLGSATGNLCWLLARIGPSRTEDVAARAGVSAGAVRGGVLRAGWDLFPHLDVTVGYVLLFGVYCGLVPDGIDGLLVSGVDWAGDSSILLSYVKGRTAAESLNLPRSAVRLLEQWLDHSRLLHGFLPAGQREQLWIGLSLRGHVTVATGPVPLPDRGHTLAAAGHGQHRRRHPA